MTTAVTGGGEWIDVCALHEIDDRKGRAVAINGTDVAVLRVGDQVHAVGGLCPHRGGLLADGTVIGGSVVCPLHHWDFDLRSGVSPYDPNDRVPVFRARVSKGRIEVDAASVPLGPGRPDVYLGPWIRRGARDRGMHDVHALAGGVGPPIGAMGSLRGDPAHDTGRRYPSLDDVVFRPAQLRRLPLLDHEPVDTSVVLGARAVAPLRLGIPLFVSHMSFGALSREAKIALAMGARAAGTAVCSGEGGMLPDERAAAGAYVLEMASGYFGWTEDAVASCDAVEIKIGQGAKPGLGGQLPASKVTEEIAAVRGLPPGAPSHSPSRFPDLNSPDELAARILAIRGLNPRIPVGIKFGAGDVEADLAVAVDAGADWVTIDGFGGGTGAAPVHVKDHVGVPSWTVIARARRWLDQHGATDVQLVATGGYRTPDEMAKVLALGADAVALATSALMAIGCQQYRACHQGTCPVGIATQDPRLRGRLEIETSANRLLTFLTTATAMIVDYCRLTGRHAVRDLGPDDLEVLASETAALLSSG
jgi:glutamate synthase domain-containing protein 2/nitrite reductase/ring-hydroxylating ferredoxin subunit